MEPVSTTAAAATVAAGGTVAATKVAGASVAPVALAGIVTDLLAKAPQFAGIIIVCLMSFYFIDSQQQRFDDMYSAQTNVMESMAKEQTAAIRDLNDTLQNIELQTELLRADIDELRDDVHQSQR